MPSTIEIEVPDMLARALGADAADLPRRSLEALVVEAYRDERLTHAEVAQILGLNRWDTDAFLKARRAFPKSESAEYLGDFERLRLQLGR